MRTRVAAGLLLVGLLVGPTLAFGQDASAAAKPAVARPNPDALGVYHHGDGVTDAKILYTVEPEFSETARKKKISGRTVVALVVTADGHLQGVHVVRSAAEDHPAKLRAVAVSLDEKAMEAVRQYRFEPAMFQGKPVPYELTVEVIFQIF